MSRLGRDLRGALLLIGALFRRLAREGIVVRSLTFPIALVIGTMVLTIGTVAYIRFVPIVALSPDLATDSLTAALIAHDFRPIVVDDPKAAIDNDEAWAGSDGEVLWLRGGGPGVLVVESLIREQLGASWRPSDQVTLPGASAASDTGRNVVLLLGVLFSLYGVVFGAGMVARDRDDSTFEVELSLAVSRWVHGFVRVMAGSLVLGAFMCLGVAMCATLLGLNDPAAMSRHAIACATGSTCIGLLCIGRSGVQSGFSSALAVGMVLATSLFAVGALAPSLGRWLPMASLFAGESSGWQAIAGMAVLGVLSVVVFTKRSAAM